MHHENGPAGNAIARPGASRIRASSCWWPKIPLIPNPPSLHFPACLNAAGRVTLRFKRLSGSGDGDCSSLKDRHRLKLFLFPFFFYFLQRHVWLSFNEHNSFSPPPRLRNKTSPPMGNRFWGCVLSHRVCVCVCFPGWWARLWPSKWARTLRTSAPQMWPTWLVGVPRLSNVVFIPTEREKKRQAIIIGAPLHLRPPDGHFFKKVKCYFIYFSLSPSVDSEHTPHWHVMASF